LNPDRLQLAQEFFEKAREELESYRREQREVHLREACEKAWAAIAQALMHVAGRPITRHKDFERVARQYWKVYGREPIAGERAGDQLHSGGFYHGALDEILQPPLVSSCASCLLNAKLSDDLAGFVPLAYRD